MTLSATAEALTGLGTKFGQSIVNGNAVLDDINPQMPQIRHDIQRSGGSGRRLHQGRARICGTRWTTR